MRSIQRLATAAMIHIDKIYTKNTNLTKMNSDQLKSHKNKGKKDYSILVIVFKYKVSFSLVKLSKSKDFSCGDTTLAWITLENNFEPDNAQTSIELKEKVMKCKLKNVDENPDEWITTLENVRVRLEDLGHEM